MVHVVKGFVGKGGVQRGVIEVYFYTCKYIKMGYLFEALVYIVYIRGYYPSPLFL
jgi:hypothetical protein